MLLFVGDEEKIRKIDMDTEEEHVQVVHEVGPKRAVVVSERTFLLVLSLTGLSLHGLWSPKPGSAAATSMADFLVPPAAWGGVALLQLGLVAVYFTDRYCDPHLSVVWDCAAVTVYLILVVVKCVKGDDHVLNIVMPPFAAASHVITLAQDGVWIARVRNKLRSRLKPMFDVEAHFSDAFPGGPPTPPLSTTDTPKATSELQPATSPGIPTPPFTPPDTISEVERETHEKFQRRMEMHERKQSELLGLVTASPRVSPPSSPESSTGSPWQRYKSTISTRRPKRNRMSSLIAALLSSGQWPLSNLTCRTRMSDDARRAEIARRHAQMSRKRRSQRLRSSQGVWSSRSTHADDKTPPRSPRTVLQNAKHWNSPPPYSNRPSRAAESNQPSTSRRSTKAKDNE